MGFWTIGFYSLGRLENYKYCIGQLCIKSRAPSKPISSDNTSIFQYKIEELSFDIEHPMTPNILEKSAVDIFLKNDIQD